MSINNGSRLYIANFIRAHSIRTQRSILDPVMRKTFPTLRRNRPFSCPSSSSSSLCRGCFEEDDEDEDEHRTTQRLR